ncbi:putative nuclear condensin complex subunit Smc4 [Morchella conica CCBAS932]|uniref:Structural maintenance of chromosomes protein n=2 Tax=Morchella sect. Distantes TaxID=1051054 RepID=A0A3N4L157_9PEZI|nr:putative nuclear condensin complex subunit Smc4 [Morchella conica CCBAS932]
MSPRPGSRDSMLAAGTGTQAPLVVKNRANTLFEQQQAEELAGPKPRLVITHLVLVNFKSYAGRQEVGPFHASFSSVVGPNGSGKSNVIDSLLFVFGFRASKMRQGKISALIHNSAHHPHLDHCEVQVHFREVLDSPTGGDPTPLPDTTLVVSRRAFKNNSSKYYINDNVSDFTAVTGLLRARGIDLDHKRFLILQGEVESIAQMKPKASSGSDDGLLEYLEDIIGTSKYKSPIEESASQAEELNEVCVEKQGRVSHVEKEKVALEGRKDAALEYLQNENDLALKKGALYQLFVGECEENVAVTGGVVAQVQARLDEELERRGGSEEGIRRLEGRYKEGAREVEEVEEATKAILKEMSRNDKENVKFQEKEKFLTQKQKKLQKSIQTNKLAASEATSMIEKHISDITRHSAEIASHEQNLAIQEAELERIRDTLKEKTQGFSDQIAAKQKSLEPWKEKINEKQSAIAVAQSELDILHEKANASNNALEEARAKITTIQHARATKEQELQQCRQELRRLEKEAAKVETSLEAMAAKEAPLRSNLSSARQKADEAKASLAATQTQGNVLTALMRLKESGRIEGFHGRLGNLGTIDSRYDVAISTACPQLDNMVVDTVDAGQRAIDHLRKNNLGRANFICLDKLPSRNLSPIPTPENVPRLFDLVTPKTPLLAPAFYNVLQNTLVAADLAQANRIAYGAQRWRVVTLTGALIDKSGTLTGGGSTISRGRMSSKLTAETTRDQVTALEVDRDAQERAYTAFQTQQRELATTLRDLRERIPETQTAISKIELELSSAARHLADAEKRVKELTVRGRKSNADESVGRIRTLEQHVATLESEISDLHSETAGLEAEIRELQDRIMSAGGIQLRSQKGKVDGLREQLELANEQVAAADLARVKAEKNLAKAQKAHSGGVAELDAVAEELEALKDEIRAHQLSCQESAARAEEAAAYLEEKKDGLAALKAELDERTAELNKTRAAEIEMKNKLEEHHKVLVENQKRSAHWQKELSKLSLHSVAGLTGGAGGEDAMDEDTEMPVYSRDELADLDKAQLNAQIAALEEKLASVNVDLAVLGEYRRRVEEHAARSADLDTAVAARDGVKTRLDDLRNRRLEEFMAGFSAISLRLKEMYQMITMGGNAELELVDSLDPFSEGILFSVMPPKKSWKNISNLSGGEKTLSSLALVFALHHYKPTPLYVMDEIDAALDFRNVSIVASYIKERTKNAQFIVISLRNNMFELAERLVGVYKVNHMTKSVTIENRDYIEKR